MNKLSKVKILFVCSEFFAGMAPFGANIVNCMEDGENEIFGVFVSSPQCDYRKIVKNKNSGNYRFIETPLGKIGRLLFRIFPYQVFTAIRKICRENKVDIIHFLTEDSSMAFIGKQLQRKYKLLYTVHDLKTHDERSKHLVQKITRRVLVYKRVNYLIKNSSCLVTCSKEQFQQLLQSYPEKKVFFHNFPSLMTESISNGMQSVEELADMDDYILFFGRIELYKGVHILYDEYLKSPELQLYPLVIAGSGSIYFDRRMDKEQNIIFVNRYINDEEIKDLFTKAHCVIYPYISATQSGVVSISDYFMKPVVVSNVPYLMDCIIEGETGYSFDINQPSFLPDMVRKANDLKPGKSLFDNNVLRLQLTNIYNLLLK